MRSFRTSVLQGREHVSSQGGAKAARKADWTALRGRHVTTRRARSTHYPQAGPAESVTSLRDLAAQIREATYPPHHGTRHERGHDVALNLAPMIRRAYQAAGRRTADFQTSTSDGVKALAWCLSRFGHRVRRDAIPPLFKRRKI